MRILVTGGAGFIGSNLIHYLLRKDRAEPIERVICLDALTYSGNPENLAGLEGDSRYLMVHGSINDDALLAKLLATHQIQGVMHLAAETHVDRSIDSPELFFQSNVIGTLRLVEACRRHWRQLPGPDREQFRFLHVSTDEVFGSLEASDPPFSEETAYDPHSPYAASKAGSDHLVSSYWHTYGFPVLTTNCSNNYGPRQFPEKLIPLMILSALQERPLPVYGDGRQCRDWLYVEDHCRALDAILRRGIPGETYAVGSGSDITNLEIVHHLCRLLDQYAPRPGKRPHAENIAHVADRPGHDRRYAISNAKVRSDFGWKPEETLATGLEKTVRWYLENKSWSESITKRTAVFARLGTADPKAPVKS